MIGSPSCSVELAEDRMGNEWAGSLGGTFMEWCDGELPQSVAPETSDVDLAMSIHGAGDDRFFFG